MKRAEELRPLSDDHHQGLVQARRLREVAAGERTEPLEEAAGNFLDFWQRDTSAHLPFHEPSLARRSRTRRLVLAALLV
jgi:hypothetical protein